ncbi:FAD-binding oxidoreductase [Kineobactrum salinum]|uniref:FAD-binding oxidoreductase n=2 Tax=Kineobactrum salinum TaxID=2708301 RepID=A0A6C0U5N0_9GAMM|nr:FAD-binding oxidoreductase [Kineobactrum salinum]
MHSCDVAIVGGGLIGCAAAFYLAKLGKRVIVIEAASLNGGASGRNAGSLHFQLEYRLLEYQEQLQQHIAHLVPFTRRAIEQWRGLETQLGEDLELVMHGGLMVAETAAQLQRLQQKYEFETRHGLALELLSRSELLARAPYLDERVQGALYCPDEGHCNPRYLTLAFARAARQLGAIFHTGTRVQSIRRRHHEWALQTAATGAGDMDRAGPAEYRCDAILNAAGAWAADVGRLAGVHLPIFPVGLSMNVTEEAPPLVEHLIQHVGRRLSMKQVREGNLLIGGGWSARLPALTGKGSATAQPLYRSVRGNLAAAAAVVPAVRELHLLRTWTGVTGVTADQLPLLGEVPQIPRFFVAAGGSGFTFGPSYAELISQLIATGDTAYPVTPFSPGRFSHINMFMREAGH